MFTRDQIGRRGQELLIAYTISAVVFALIGSPITMISWIILIPLIYFLELIGLLYSFDLIVIALISFLFFWFLFSLQHKFYAPEHQNKLAKIFSKKWFVIWRWTIDLTSLLLIVLLFGLLTSSIAFALYNYFYPII